MLRTSSEIGDTSLIFIVLPKLVSPKVMRSKAMNMKSWIRSIEQKTVLALRQYPLQILSVVTISFLFLAILTASFFVPHRAHGQSILNQSETSNNTISTGDNSGLTARTSYAD